MSNPTTADALDRIAMALQRGITRGIRRTAGVDRAAPLPDRTVATILRLELDGPNQYHVEPAPLEDLTPAQLEVAAELRRRRLEDAPPEVIHRRVDHLEVLNRRTWRARS